MSFVVETGAGLANSNSYASVAAYKAYCDDRGMVWAGQTDSQIQTYLVKSTDYIDQRFGLQFIGAQSLPDSQALEFPRDAFSGVPVRLAHACIEYAFRVATNPLWNIPVASTGGILTQEIKKVGPIETSKSYMAGGPTIIAAYPPGDKLIRPFLATFGQATSFR